MIYLESDQLEALKEAAKAQRVSMAELFRRIADRYLKEQQSTLEVPREKYLEIIALGSSGRSDISEYHDRHLAERILHEHRG